MTALVTEHLPLVAGAPEGIKRLRELVLNLAIQGRLLNQSPDDEPAEALLLRLSEDRQQKVRSKLIRAAKPMAPASVDDLGSPLPSGWVAVRLGEIGDWGAGATPARSNSAYYGGKMPWFKSGELTSDLIDCSEESVTDLALKECSLRLNQPGDVLIAMYGATIGKTAILAVPATTNQAVCACTPFKGVFNGYLLLVLKALRSQFVGQGAGGAQPNISKEKIVATTIGLPPEPEQHRIVAKVDELMALCDRLEADQADAEAAHAQLVQALLSSLTQATDAADFRAHWQRLSEHFHTLFTTEASIDALKQTVLQLAVMGKLSERQDREVLWNAASVLREEGRPRGRAMAVYPPVGAEEQAFVIPDGWEWKRLGECSEQITDGEHLTPPRVQDPGAIPLVTAKNVRDGYMDYASTDFVERSVAEKCWQRCKPEVGDVLMVSVGATLGRLTVVREAREMVIVRSVALIKPSLLASDFMALVLRSPLVQRAIWASVKQSAQPCLYLKPASLLAVPVPPIPEQHRIVAKVDELMALCDQLKAQLADARQQHAQLATALIEQAVA